MEVFMFYLTHALLFCCLTAIVYVITPKKDQQEQFDDWEE